MGWTQATAVGNARGQHRGHGGQGEVDSHLDEDLHGLVAPVWLEGPCAAEVAVASPVFLLSDLGEGCSVDRQVEVDHQNLPRGR